MKGFGFEIIHFGIFDSSMKFHGQTLSKERTVGFFEFELFTADSHRLSYINGRPVSRERGTLICAKPGQTRYSELPFRCHYLHLSSDDEDFITLMESLPDTVTVPDTAFMSGLYEDLIKYEGDTPEDILRLQSIVYKLLSYIIQLAYSSPSETDPALHTYRKPLMETASYIKHHLSEKLTLNQLAAVASLSPIYFHRLFTERFGKTPNQYVLEHRIAAAKLALLSDNVSVADVAADCGFSTQSYFNNKFKEITGMTPLQYRRHMLGRLKL